MEECNGGELFQRLADNAKHNKNYTEKDAARIMKQILQAVNYLHSHGVCHRDLKPENILFSSVEPNSELKIIDFGLSKVLKEIDQVMKGEVGTLYYMAPEVIQGNYNEKCDVWSCGVILYIILSGHPPFYSKNEEKLKQKICNIEYSLDLPAFSKISDDAKDLIKKILVKAEDRPSIAEVLQSTWVKENAPKASKNAIQVDWGHIKKYTKLNLVQKSIITFRAFHMTAKEAQEYIEMFKMIDKNNDGVLTIDEIEKGVKHCKLQTNMSEEAIIQLFKDMDIDKNGLVNYTEFVSALMDYEKEVKKEHIIECFNSYDADKSGKINFKEFCEIISPQNEKEKKELKELYDKFDNNGDGEIDFNEFLEGYRNM
jgi:calcium-dependent protein kinase